MGRRKHKYFLYRLEDNEMIFSAPYFEDVEEYIEDELQIHIEGNLEDYYILKENGTMINLEYLENDGYH